MSNDKEPGSATPMLAAAAEGATATASPEPAPHAVEPKHEMSFSESTTHWLARGEGGGAALEIDDGPGSGRYEQPTPWTRRRDLGILAGAILVAIFFLFLIHGRAPAPPPAPPSRSQAAAALVERAVHALTIGRTADAVELARQALTLEPAAAEAFAVTADAHHGAGRAAEAAAAYRRYLELAPVGPQAAHAREQLAGIGDAGASTVPAAAPAAAAGLPP